MKTMVFLERGQNAIFWGWWWWSVFFQKQRFLCKAPLPLPFRHIAGRGTLYPEKKIAEKLVFALSLGTPLMKPKRISLFSDN